MQQDFLDVKGCIAVPREPCRHCKGLLQGREEREGHSGRDRGGRGERGEREETDWILENV